MDTHLSTEEIKNFRARSLSAEELDNIDDHLHSCATCYQAFLIELEKRFPIEFDLDELAGMKGWHLEGEELDAYVECRMEKLDFECAILHLDECSSCRDEVSAAFEYRLKFPGLNKRTSSKPSTWRRWLSSFLWLSRHRLHLVRAAAVLLALALIVWAVLQSRPSAPKVAKVPQPLAPSPDPQQSTPPPHEPPSVPDSNEAIAVNRTTGRKLPEPAHHGAGRREDEIESALIARDLVMPAAIEMLDRTPAVAVRGTGSAIESFAILRPFATVISSDRPTFSWTALSGATRYTVTVYDAALHLVGTSEPLRETQWSMRNRLKAGVVYTWMVTAFKDGQETIAPAPPARAEFKILEKAELTMLNRIVSRTASNAARGVLYAEVGLLDDAERELRTHLDLRPADERVKQLLRTIKSWRNAERVPDSPITAKPAH